MNPWLTIAAAAVPEVAALVRSILALRKKYPGLTADQITTIVDDTTAQSDAAFDDALAAIAADKAAHP